VLLRGVKVDVIETHPLDACEIEGLGDAQRLFVAAHRWAYETATSIDIGTLDRYHRVPVATPAALLMMKAHAAGHARAARRASKHGNDLYDIYALIEAYSDVGTFRSEVEAAPWGLPDLFDAVVRRELLREPERAARQMSASSDVDLRADDVVSAVGSFLHER
jgi:hypothetical protein